MTTSMPPGETVTVGLVSGHEMQGTIDSFSPYVSHLHLHASDAPSGTHDLPADIIVYVAFHRDPAEPPLPPPPSEHGVYRVRVPGGRVFEVVAPPKTKWKPTGFYGLPLHEPSPYREFFFFTKRSEAQQTSVAPAMPPASGTLQVVTGRMHRSAASEADDAARAGRRPHKLGEILVEAGIVAPSDLERALVEQKVRPGKRLGQVLVELGLVHERDLAHALAKRFNLPFADLDRIEVPARAREAVTPQLAEKYHVIPVDADDRSVVVAVSDPLQVDPIDSLRAVLGKAVGEVVCTPSQLHRHLEAYVGHRTVTPGEGQKGGEIERIVREIATSGKVRSVGHERVVADISDSDTGIIKLVNHIITEAFDLGASDIHIEPDGLGEAVLRYRIDGDCAVFHNIPAPLAVPVVARIKIMADLDISERRKPQDGKIKFRAAGQPLELRVATLPTVGGVEDVVLRILPPSTPKPLEGLGMTERNLREMKRLVTQPYGLVLCVGPTGSGKTTTLHSALGHINRPDMKIWTAEDPVEITQMGLRQVQVNTRIGFDFATAMRSFLRADPDVIMVGEMRDKVTASIAIEASLTGHLVLSTLHTNNAPETVMRLLDMGLDPFSFADSLLGVLAQRLVRTLCERCKRPREATEQERDELLSAFGDEASLRKMAGVADGDPLTVWQGVGCKSCGNSGYRGRAAIHELLVVDDKIRHAISHSAPAEELRTLAVETGMTTLLQDGVVKCVSGLTDMRQVLSVCSR